MPLMFVASTWEVLMSLADEDRAIARSDEPEARSEARVLGTDAEIGGVSPDLEP